MYSHKITGSSRFTSTILTLDTAYVESICANYFGDNIITRADKVLQSYYPKPEYLVPCVMQEIRREVIVLPV